ncbi:MAG TPA: HAMP domain-containing histidine kinase, partial [Chromatiales bacterium]|nr:HAMP domain-containing histidine kinase [Chromatiales bacterium]
LGFLYRSVALALRFAERRSNFAAAVSHELKTPLTAIRMYGEMLRDDVVPSEAKRQEYYRHITSESERLSRLINNVLEFAKLEKGNRRGRSVRAPVAATLAEVVEMMRPHAAEQGYELVLDVAPDLPAVRHEPDAFAQVLWNLIDNAVKYARGTGNPRIVVSARRDPSDDRRVVVAVRDHGPGVESRHLREIFSPFYRGENELTRTATGAGLGLALVRSLAERMGAAVRGFNHPDGGFAVEIAFPIVG